MYTAPNRYTPNKRTLFVRVADEMPEAITPDSRHKIGNRLIESIDPHNLYEAACNMNPNTLIYPSISECVYIEVVLCLDEGVSQELM